MENWTVPVYLLAVLAFMGSGIIRRAIAPISGIFLPAVAFSFGWVAYAFDIFAQTLSGEGMLMPKPDHRCMVINGSSRRVCKNRSWILGRLLQDFEYWKPHGVELSQEVTNQGVDEALASGKATLPVPLARERAGLCVPIFYASGKFAGDPMPNVFYSGAIPSIIQLLIALIPCVVHREPETVFFTVAGIILVYVTGILPRWKEEKLDCGRVGVKKTTVLTRGIGAPYALVIVADEDSLDLEKLATLNPKMSLSTMILTALLAVLWSAHLASVLYFVRNPLWLVMIEAVGTLHSHVVAALPRMPEALGLSSLILRECIIEATEMDTLKQLERKYPGVGESMLPIFFPEGLSEEDKLWWAEQACKREARRILMSTVAARVVEESDSDIML